MAIDGGVGTVNLTTPGETTVTVTGTSAAMGESFTKTFGVLTGEENVFATAKSTSPAAGLEGKTSEFAVDGDLESEFVTSAGNYRVNIDLQEVKPFSKLRIFEADTAAKIEEFTISVSSNNVDFTEVYKGTEINSGESFSIDYSEARFVRIVVTKTSGSGTGIKEICAYNEMTDLEKLEYDYKALTENLTVKDGTIIPKTGKFGTVFTLSSDNDAVTITETADKKSWKVTVGSSDEEVTVNVTLGAVNGTASADAKSYQITVLADTDIRGNTISGGGSGGGGGGKVSSNVAFTPNTEQIQKTYLHNELTNHWGANEIKNLIARGIIEGNGASLNLGGNVTRAEFCKMIVTGFGYELIDYRGSFADVNENDWFASFAETAAANGIMSGDERGFRGNDTISRQEMAVVLVNVLKAQLGEVTAENEVSFTDSESIALWAKDAVELSAGLGILNGYDTGDFGPERNLKRDEAMVVVYRVLSYVGK